MPVLAQVEQLSVVIAVGEIPVRVNTTDAGFLAMLEDRYAGFVSDTDASEFEFDIELIPSGNSRVEDVRVACRDGKWLMTRGDFRAEWNPAARKGNIRQTANPYSIDAVLRITHTLILAGQGGFLLHSASAIRNGKAFLFAGVSGAGKTTISRLAPPDATLLTDEISYVRKVGDQYVAFGTPFTGELAKLGENTSAPVDTLFLLGKAQENRVEPVGIAEAGRELLANMLFFAEDQEMVGRAFQAACEFVEKVPVRRLHFVPDARVWDLVR
ncbi:MAG TPA: hypothetical protein VND65_14125 [Candidatus Binatia bacterium]|nr:hypothetical protein [Candidatus Binatia bacterium]